MVFIMKLVHCTNSCTEQNNRISATGLFVTAKFIHQVEYELAIAHIPPDETAVDKPQISID